MQAVAMKKRDYGQPVQADGRVVACGADEILVSTDAGDLRARRALSCLIAPMAGDRVLVAGVDELFVIAVLERPEAGPLTITADGDLMLAAPAGRLSIIAAQGVDLVTTKDMTLTASEIAMRAPKAKVFLDNLTYLGRKVLAQTEAVKHVGGIFDTVLERISQRVKRSYRTVEEIDQVRSEQIDYRAEKNLCLKGQNALMTAHDLVKLDADQIHLG